MKKRLILNVLAAVFFMMAVLCGVLYTKRMRLQNEVAGKVMRFHVLANSDSEEDQALKLKVRDAVGVFMQQKLEGVGSLNECEEVTTESLGMIVKTAEKVITEEGYDYTVQASVERTDFPVKSYGAFTFPAGEYEALRVVIGNGKGHNWWCVMYPNLCFSDSMYEVESKENEKKLKEVLSEQEYEKILEEGTYTIQCKYLTFLNPYLTKLTE